MYIGPLKKDANKVLGSYLLASTVAESVGVNKDRWVMPGADLENSCGIGATATIIGRRPDCEERIVEMVLVSFCGKLV